MPANPGPTWYDILGVPTDATPEQVKAAWRAATDKFEPGSGTSQFRLFNEAADVLLDPERRAAYDAELAGDAEPVEALVGARTEAPDATAPEVAPVEVPADTAAPTDEPPVVPVDPTSAGLVSAEQDSDDAPPAPEATEPANRRTGLAGALGRAYVPVLAVVLGDSLALIALCVVLVTGLHSTVTTADARDEATSVAERALTSVLSYDYRHMEADRDRAAQFLTPSYRKQYLKNFNDLLTKGPDGTPGPAVKTQAVVKAEVLDTGVVDAESNRVRVIVFVNQSSTKGSAAPSIFQDRVVATMVRRGDAWLVDNIKSY